MVVIEVAKMGELLERTWAALVAVCTADGQLFFRAFRGTRISKLVQLSKLDTNFHMGLGARRSSLSEDDARLLNRRKAVVQFGYDPPLVFTPKSDSGKLHAWAVRRLAEHMPMLVKPRSADGAGWDPAMIRADCGGVPFTSSQGWGEG